MLLVATPSPKSNPIVFLPKYANNFGPKNVKPYVNINGNANNQGYQVQVGTGISNQRGYNIFLLAVLLIILMYNIKVNNVFFSYVLITGM